MVRGRLLERLMLLYGAASLVHFVHNAAYLDAYPNMPVWLTPTGVMASWLLVAAVGFLGYSLLKRGHGRSGAFFVAAFACLGFAGLDHYAIAPVSAHTLATRATIAAEVVLAGVLLVAVIWLALTGRLNQRSTGSAP